MTLCYRLTITLINIIFPPLAVILLTGFGMDTLINWCVQPPPSLDHCFPSTPTTTHRFLTHSSTSLLFLAAVLPSHVHGFYISYTYFARRRRVRKGRWPGGPKSFVTSEDVLCGGASPEELRRLKRRGRRRARDKEHDDDDEVVACY